MSARHPMGPPTVTHYYAGFKAMAAMKRRPQSERCHASNWVTGHQCKNQTYVMCGWCGHRTCGTHATWHRVTFRDDQRCGRRV